MVGWFFFLPSAEMDLYVPVKVSSIKTEKKEVADLPGCVITSGLSLYLVLKMIKSFAKLSQRT